MYSTNIHDSRICPTVYTSTRVPVYELVLVLVHPLLLVVFFVQVTLLHQLASTKLALVNACVKEKSFMVIHEIASARSSEHVVRLSLFESFTKAKLWGAPRFQE